MQKPNSVTISNTQTLTKSLDKSIISTTSLIPSREVWFLPLMRTYTVTLDYNTHLMTNTPPPPPPATAAIVFFYFFLTNYRGWKQTAMAPTNSDIITMGNRWQKKGEKKSLWLNVTKHEYPVSAFSFVQLYYRCSWFIRHPPFFFKVNTMCATTCYCSLNKLYFSDAAFISNNGKQELHHLWSSLADPESVMVNSGVLNQLWHWQLIKVFHDNLLCLQSYKTSQKLFTVLKKCQCISGSKCSVFM